jgi:hypothetical protein
MSTPRTASVPCCFAAIGGGTPNASVHQRTDDALALRWSKL